jgi:phage terminase large subunit
MSPTEFCVRKLGIVPYMWQCEAMEAVAMERPSSIVAANGSGKTAVLVAPLILWFLNEYPRGQVIFTSGSWMQIEKQLWGAVKRFSRLFPTWRFMADELRTPEGGYAYGFSTDNPGRAEGHHPKVSSDVDPVFLIIDEAKTVPNGIFEAFDRCTRRFELWVSSPGAPRGQFYESHRAKTGLYFTRKVTSAECPHIPQERIDRDREKYGEDHPWFRSKHLAEFTEDNDLLCLSPLTLTNALANQPNKQEAGQIVAFCDFAAGRDENVLALRRGNHARIIKAWQERDTMQAVRQFVQMFKEEKLTPGQIWGDADGLGTVMIDAMAEAGWRINRFHGGQTARKSDEYANLIGEVWQEGCLQIASGKIHLGNLDATTFDQLTGRKSEWTATGKLRVEDKDKMRSRGLKSPDRADALLGCIACGSAMSGAIGIDSTAVASKSPFASKSIKRFNAI